MKIITASPCSLAWFRSVALGLALVTGLCATTPAAFAGNIPSTAIVSGTTRTADLATIRQSLEHKQVQQRLGELGFTETEVQQRLAHASDAELHQLAIQSEKIAAGGDGGIIITVLLIILLVVAIGRLS